MYRLKQLIQGVYPTKRCEKFFSSNNQVLKEKRRLSRQIMDPSLTQEERDDATRMLRNMPLETIRFRNVVRLGTDTNIKLEERIRLCLYVKKNREGIFCRIPFLNTPIGRVELTLGSYCPIPARKEVMHEVEVRQILMEGDDSG